MPFGKFDRLQPDSETTQTISPDAKAHILVIDDDAMIREMLAFSLRRSYEVRLCANGEDGVNTVDERVDAVILDIKMPGKDGLQAYQDIKVKYPDLPIIFYSAFQDLLEGARLRKEYRPFDYLPKDNNIEELFRCLEKAVRYYQITRHVSDMTIASSTPQ